MHTRTEKPRTDQQTLLQRSSSSLRTGAAQSHDECPPSIGQHSVGNRSMVQSLGSRNRGTASDSTTCASSNAGHDFSRIGIHAHREAMRHTDSSGGGELLSDDPLRQTILGGDGDGVSVPQTQPATAGNSPAAPAASLTYSTVTPRTRQGCGGYEYAVQWGLDNATASTDGFIVQKLQFNLVRDICAGGTNNFAKTYWEAWQVKGGKIFIGTSTSPHHADTFRVGATPDQKGVNLEEGNAKFIEGYTEPLSWGTVPEAGSLPATETEPAGWSDAGTKYRSVQVDFDCCEQSDLGNITGQG